MRNPHYPFQVSLALTIIAISLAGCANQLNTPAAAIQAYILALVGGDYSPVANLSCTAWEAQAKTEFDSFGAVVSEVQDLQCQESGHENEFTLVKCTGRIVANYGNEVLEIDLSQQTYQALQEGGDWRMCGYQ